jgi:hypothetical protein
MFEKALIWQQIHNKEGSATGVNGAECSMCLHNGTALIGLHTSVFGTILNILIVLFFTVLNNSAQYSALTLPCNNESGVNENFSSSAIASNPRESFNLSLIKRKQICNNWLLALMLKFRKKGMLFSMVAASWDSLFVSLRYDIYIIQQNTWASCSSYATCGLEITR